jgi:hypothetical protein
MPYIGNEVGNRFVASKAASVYSGNGSTTAFTLEHDVGSDEDILVSVDGVIQEPSVAYAVSSGTTLTFTAAPSSNSGNNIFVYYLFRTVATVDHPSTSSLQATDGTFTAGITGTLQTAAQTNITSVGTLTSFRSTGIDDNADALAITIDSSENVIFGATATGHQTTSDTQGLSYEKDKFLAVSRSGNDVVFFNRQSSDGSIINVRKDGTTVGNVGTINGDLNIFSSASGHAGLRFANGYVAPANNAGNISDNTADLGIAAYRFKDFYLSGNIYIGGTGSANGLDDYEEGTFTPSAEGSTTAGTVSHTSSPVGRYTKVGRDVTIFMQLNFTLSGEAGVLRITGLPFACSTSQESVGSFQCNNMENSYASNVAHYNSIIQGGESHVHFRGTTSDGSNYHSMAANNMTYIRVSITYPTG